MAKRKYFFFSPAPIRLLTKEPVTPANALTITENSAETLLTMFDTANSFSPKRSIATKNRNQMATLVKNWSILHTEIENTSFNIVISICQYKPYAFLSMCRNIYAANTASEHISADEDAIVCTEQIYESLFVQFNSTHLPKFSPLLSLTLFGCSLYLLIAKNCFSIFHAIAFS